MRTPYRRADTDARYVERIRRAVAYIWTHLDRDVPLERLAEIACFSPYHFHRIYRALLGETVFDTVQRGRLHQAARRLSASDQPLAQIARRAGYGSLAAFVRGFGRHYGTTPGRYRAGVAHRLTSERESYMQSVQVREQPALLLLLRRHRGSYMNIGEAFDDLLLRAMPVCPDPAPVRAFGLYYDDPDGVPESALRSAAAFTWSADWPVPDGLELLTLPAGRYAVARHTGPYSELQAAWRRLYVDWLPQSGFEPADQPCLEEYLNNPRDTAPMALQTDLMTPLK
ncbi:MAG: AraC family transcriptional regulator [Paludibacterium sp.]|uniref:AraC family transcriptional regulator n=1 Tax=Paludibacterium sp. TaxID=1917523 RepID=UPI0025CDF133|nr:AraC family transcriptional regulator [Paludibacterium sp.]MBV8046420.1 AraC family transcriptional regulator [Paludibacterium sp.]MBV8648915.1 AraC family transcriptional regulator [Paludibacterium sp.]